MTIKGIVREVQRAEKRRAREALRTQKLAEMQATADSAVEAVREYEDLVYDLSNMHADVGKAWDWQAIDSKGAPVEPKKANTQENAAKLKLDSYTPGRADKLMRRGDKKRAQFEQGVEEGKRLDKDRYQEALVRYRDNLATYELSHRILAREAEAFVEAIEKYGPWRDIPRLAQSLSFSTDDAATIEVDLLTFGEDQIPKEKYTQLKSGKLSIKDMPKSQYWALYQNHVCGSALRVARETFALVPTKLVIATVLDNMLNPSTGHLEDIPILSVAIPRATVETLNIDAVIPGESMSNFVHNMAFKKTKGFYPVEKIKATDLSQR